MYQNAGKNMKNFFIITNLNKDKELEVTGKIKTYLEKAGAKCLLFSDDLSQESVNCTNRIPKETECILVLGGDGTMLQAARENQNYDIPMIGINMGTKGYLTEIEVNNLEEALECLLKDEFHIESRMMLSGVIHKAGQVMPKMCALNEVAITRKGSLAVIHYNVYVNGNLLKVYNGDGIMVSTPTGSTGYNLSAGGPIASPQSELMLLTPICPHTFNTRTVILSPFDVVEIEIAHGRDGKMQEVEVNFDGNYKEILYSSDRVIIKKATETTKIVKLSEESFLEVLHSKMRD